MILFELFGGFEKFEKFLNEIKKGLCQSRATQTLQTPQTQKLRSLLREHFLQIWASVEKRADGEVSIAQLLQHPFF